MTPRFWATHIEKNRAILDPQESHHAIRVLRLKSGDRVFVFDGKGTEWEGRIDRIARDSVEVLLLRALPGPAPDPKAQVYVMVAPPKGQRWDFLLEKLTEIGVTGIVPVVTERTVRRIRDQRPRWFRIVLSAVKQSGRRTIPTIFSPFNLEEALEWGQALDVRWVGVPGATNALVPSELNEKAGILIGPEGGWSPRELQQIEEAGFRPFSLGPRILRVETAALVSATLILHRELAPYGSV